jgi:hypothetical protein
VVGIQDVLYRTWLATYPSEMFGINVDDIEEMYKDRNSEETLAKRREQVSRPQETTLVAKEKDKVVGLCRIIKREDKSGDGGDLYFARISAPGHRQLSLA